MDVDGSSGFWKQYFKSLPVLRSELNNTEVVLEDRAVVNMQTYSTMTCPFDPVSPGTCRLDSQSITSNTVTESHTQTYSYQGRAGFNIKVKGGVSEAAWEQTFDLGYSTSSGEATSKLSGDTSARC